MADPAGGAMRNNWRLLQLLPAAGRRDVVELVALTAARSVLPLAVIAMTGTLVARVAGGPRLGDVTPPLVALAVLIALQQILGPLAVVVGNKAIRSIDGSLRVRAMVAASRPAGIGLLEDQAVQDTMEVAAGKPVLFRSATPGGAAVSVVGLGGRAAQVLGAGLLVARFSVLVAAALVGGTLVVRRVSHRVNEAQARAFDDHVPAYRQAGYLTGLALEAAAAKETRVFGLGEWVCERHGLAWGAVTASMSAVRRRTFRHTAACHLAVLPLHALAFVTVGLAALDGRVGLGTLAVVLQASLQILDFAAVGGDEYQIDFGSASLPALVALEDRSWAEAAATPIGTMCADGAPRHSIRFEGVGFSYPGSPAPVFENLDLTVPAGESLAIVGPNGVGKTTLVKLLARLYEPTAGRILVDGTDIREFDVVSWRSRLAVIFQDFVRYDLRARDNVGLGDLALLGDRAALQAAATRAGARELIEALPCGWDTVLARRYTGGAELSGGEWQRVALARALLAVGGGAGVLALDEPTANLDVRSEAELFDRFLDVTEGCTTILISHRFSTVRRARHICVVDGGRVVERGSHDELVAAGGLYARMFLLQASRFDG